MSGPGRAPILVVAPGDEPWALQRYLLRAARDLGHPLADRLELVIDPELAMPFRSRLPTVGAVLFFAQDPLGPLYPEVHRYAVELERACDALGVPLVGRAEPLSRTCKSVQLALLRRAGIPAARARRLSHWRDALAGEAVPFPLFLRYDCGHASEDQGFAGPFASARELRRARLPDWPTTRRLAGVVAVEFIDVRSADGIYRMPRTWVIGDRAVRSRPTITRVWHGHRPTPEDVELFRDEIFTSLHSEPSPEETALLLRAARATGLEIAAIDHAVTRDGTHVVFEVNPYPGTKSWWADDPVFKRRVVDAFAALVERVAS